MNSRSRHRQRLSLAFCFALYGLLTSPLVAADGWTSTANWANVMSIFTVDHGASATTYTFLDPAASSNVNGLQSHLKFHVIG